MFQSYIFQYDDINKCIYYTISDTDFTENITLNHGAGVGEAVIETYEKRNLNVPTNLVRAFKYFCKAHLNDMEGIIDFNMNRCSKYKKYAGDVQKYLMLI
jgi:hypothetical protein